MNSPSLAVAGCGYIFRAVYEPILRSFAERVRVVAVCDLNSEAAKTAAASFPDARACTALEEVFNGPSPDALMVLTPEIANAPTTLRSLQAGVPVYLEKPPATRLAEWEQLVQAEEASGVPVFTAFNRRHTPLFRDWKPPRDLTRIRGRLCRKNRTISTFPYTAVHLGDSAQYFAGSHFCKMTARFETASWQVAGQMENGAECELTFAPACGTHEEILSFETKEGNWTMGFPNPREAKPGGYLAFHGAGSVETSAISPHSGNENEDMGFVACLRDFLGRIECGDWQDCPHRLKDCKGTISLLEAMLAVTP